MTKYFNKEYIKVAVLLFFCLLTIIKQGQYCAAGDDIKKTTKEQLIESVRNADFRYLELPEEERKRRIQEEDEAAFQQELRSQKALQEGPKTEQELYIEELQQSFKDSTPDNWTTNEQEILMSDKDYRKKHLKDNEQNEYNEYGYISVILIIFSTIIFIILIIYGLIKENSPNKRDEEKVISNDISDIVVKDCINLAQEECKKFNNFYKDFYINICTVEYLFAVSFAIEKILLNSKYIKKLDKFAIKYAVKKLKGDVPNLTEFEMNSIKMIRKTAYNQLYEYCKTNGVFKDSLDGTPDKDYIMSALRNTIVFISSDKESYNDIKLPFIHAQDYEKYMPVINSKEELQSQKALELAEKLYNIANNTINNIKNTNI